MTAAPAGAWGCKGNFAAYVRVIMPEAPRGSAPMLGVIEPYYFDRFWFHQPYSLDSAFK